MANGYGVGLFDSKGPTDFAAAVGKIAEKLSGVQQSFSAFGTASADALGKISKAVDDLTSKLTGLQSQMQNAAAGMGGRGGGGGGMGAGPQPTAAPSANGGSGNTGAAGGGIWIPPGARDGFKGNPLNGMQEDSASSANPPSMTKQPVPQDTAKQKPAATQTPGQGGGQGGFSWGSAVTTMGPAMAGAAERFITGPGASMISTSIQGATIGQMLGPAFGVNPRSLYVIPRGTLSQNAGDYAQANYYAMMNMGVAPGTQNWSTVQRGANQLMTLVPGMSRQGAMQAQNVLQQPGVINRALAVGLNLRPGGQLQTPEQQYAQIFNRLTMGGQVNAKTFAAMMQPGAPGQVNLSAIGIEPGTDAYYGFMQYAYSRLGQRGGAGGNLPDVGTAKGAKQAGLDTPYYAQLQAQSAKSQLESRAEPGIASAAKNLNEAAARLLQLASPLGSLLGGGIGKIGSLLTPGGMMGGIFGGAGKLGSGLLGHLLGGIFQAGGLVPGPLNEAMLAVVHGGERILTPGMMGGGGDCGCSGGGAGDGHGGFHMPNIGGFFGRIGGDITGLPRHLLGNVTGFGRRIGGDISGFGHRVWDDVTGLPRHALGAVTGFGRRIGGDIMGLGRRGLHGIEDVLKEIPGLGELFGGSWFGAGGGLVHGAMHKAGGLFHSIGHGISSLGRGIGHLAGRGLHGLEGLGKGALGGADSVMHILMGKLSDPGVANSALHSLLSPVPSGSVLADITSKGAAQPAPVLTSQKSAAPKQAAPMPKHHRHKGGILGGIESFLGGVGGDIMGGLGALGRDYAQFFGGTPAAAQTLGAAPAPPGKGTPYSWAYSRQAVSPVDVSYMYANTGASGSQTTDGSGGGSGGSGGTGAGAPTDLTGSGNVQQAYNYFISKGLKDFQSAGIIGNLAQESGVSPTASQSGGPGRGIAQWSVGQRWDQLEAWAKKGNRDPNSLATQLDYMWVELTGGEAGALSAVKAAGNVSDATSAFEQSYERAGQPNMANRIKYAQNVLASKGAGYARGTQLIARNQLAMLHRGEAVITAADNYSAMPYNKGGAMGGSSTVILNFKAGSVILQVPPTSTQRDMEDIANQFVQAISKPQLLATARSQ